MTAATRGLVSSRSETDWTPYWACLAGLLVLYLPTFYGLLNGLWGTDQQGQGPIVLVLAIWLIVRNWASATNTVGDGPRPALAWPLIALASLMYMLGRSQGILVLEVGSMLVLLPGLVLLLKGPKALKALWFPLFFLIFMVPLPAVVVDTLTQPMKIAVSHVAEMVLHAAGYPIARWGVILHIGPYQLLVADACAGLTTLLTLEAVGLMYLNLVRYASVVRNVVLALLIVPISFIANVIRVIILSLVTFYLGDEAGQGFLHGLAGIVLFLSALLLIISADAFLRTAQRAWRSRFA
jgi:exosortase B